MTHSLKRWVFFLVAKQNGGCSCGEKIGCGNGQAPELTGRQKPTLTCRHCPAYCLIVLFFDAICRILSYSETILYTLVVSLGQEQEQPQERERPEPLDELGQLPQEQEQPEERTGQHYYSYGQLFYFLLSLPL